MEKIISKDRQLDILERYRDIIRRLNLIYLDRLQNIKEKYEIKGSHFTHITGSILIIMGSAKSLLEVLVEDAQKVPDTIHECFIEGKETVHLYLNGAKRLKVYLDLIENFSDFRDGEISSTFGYFSDRENELEDGTLRLAKEFVEYANYELRKI